MVCGLVVCGLRFVVCDLWSVVCGLWSVICGLWGLQDWPIGPDTLDQTQCSIQEGDAVALSAL